MVLLCKSVLVAASAFALLANAHPGHDIEREIAERSAYFRGAKRDLSHCAAKFKERGLDDKAIKRRSVKVDNLRSKVAFEKRQALKENAKRQATPTMSGAPPGASGNGTGGIEGASVNLTEWGSEVANSSHLSSLDVDPTIPGVEDIIFSGNKSCVLTPESEVGPYYVLGELVRENLRESEPGVPVWLEGQFININTCEPIEDLYWDLWHCNSTGVYAGVVANGNGNSNDTTNLNNTALRGIQATDCDGVASFETVFPGHYSGRTTHIHVVTHMGARKLLNDTIVGSGNITHTGQLFFDQTLIDNINTNVSPYSTNTIEIVDNADDRVFADATATTGSDPVFDYVLIGDDVTDGLFAWVTIGIDPAATYTASAASVYGANGGVSESSSNSGPPS